MFLEQIGPLFMEKPSLCEYLNEFCFKARTLQSQWKRRWKEANIYKPEFPKHPPLVAYLFLGWVRQQTFSLSAYRKECMGIFQEILRSPDTWRFYPPQLIEGIEEKPYTRSPSHRCMHIIVTFSHLFVSMAKCTLIHLCQLVFRNLKIYSDRKQSIYYWIVRYMSSQNK